jgi:hypothetical protein
VQLLDLSQEPKVTNRDLANNIDFVVKHVVLQSRTALKHFHTAAVKQEAVETQLELCKKELTGLRRELKAIKSELVNNKPLTRTEVLALVKEIAQQPKIVEEQALRLTEELNKKLNKVEELIGHLIRWAN